MLVSSTVGVPGESSLTVLNKDLDPKTAGVALIPEDELHGLSEAVVGLAGESTSGEDGEQ